MHVFLKIMLGMIRLTRFWTKLWMLDSNISNLEEIDLFEL